MLHAIGSKKELTELEYYVYVADILENELVQGLKNYRHHISTNRFQHCVNVSYYNYLICRFFHLDAASAARAGLLHDLYYYDTKTYRKVRRRSSEAIQSHNAHHPNVALNNACALFAVNAVEEDIITKHMWPLTKARPQYKEGYVIVVVDKYCAALEVLAPKMRMAMQKLRRLKKQAA
ncbi:MAG: HAD family hydrolase [Ruminococcus sp.]|nr:HAD family hydrolase [Ruminococcus sp.]